MNRPGESRELLGLMVEGWSLGARFALGEDGEVLVKYNATEPLPDELFLRLQAHADEIHAQLVSDLLAPPLIPVAELVGPHRVQQVRAASPRNGALR